MEKLTKLAYYIKLFLLISNFYFIFIMLHNILDAGIYGVVFIFFYLVFVIKILLEVLFKRKYCANDIIYNVMQIGFLIYLHIISIKTWTAKVYVTRFTMSYFKINYIILSILILFILLYNLIDRNSVKQQ